MFEQKLSELIQQKRNIQIEIKKVKTVNRKNSVSDRGSTNIRVPNHFNNWINSILKERAMIGKIPMDKTVAIGLIRKHKYSVELANDIINFNLPGEGKNEK